MLAARCNSRPTLVTVACGLPYFRSESGTPDYYYLNQRVLEKLTMQDLIAGGAPNQRSLSNKFSIVLDEHSP